MIQSDVIVGLYFLHYFTSYSTTVMALMNMKYTEKQVAMSMEMYTSCTSTDVLHAVVHVKTAICVCDKSDVMYYRDGPHWADSPTIWLENS